MASIYFSYLNLTPGLRNPYSQSTHNVFRNAILERFLSWDGFFKKYPEYSLGFTISTKGDNFELTVKGPSVYRKDKDIDFSIRLLNTAYDLNGYTDLVFEGIAIALKKYDVNEEEIFSIRDACKKELGLPESCKK